MEMPCCCCYTPLLGGQIVLRPIDGWNTMLKAKTQLKAA
jgi:hypothetical protein